ncbi:MAG: hypothetical protein SVY41_00025 [Candidatus Nanohaloarchaea archaeon]|nr:hypothetical protein [Candidatus Nanohaloarchaea archaeon]
MNAETVFNRYDIRGDYPAEIDEQFAERLGEAVGTWALRNGRGSVVVGRDTRDASEKTAPAFIDGVRSTGANVVDIGIGPTDRVALAADHYGGTGAMVTASHHAWERTGFKLLYEQGNGFTNEDLDAVQQLFESGDVEQGEGTLMREHHEFDEIYIEQLLAAVEELGIDRIDTRVRLDTAGAAGRTAVAVFDGVGATVQEHEWAEQPAPEPQATTRQQVVDRMDDADIAVGYDPDGDRVYAVHPETGRVDGDRLLYALAEITGAETIVASVDTSPMVEELDAAVEYARVGDVFVAEKGIEVEADLLGEPNGHYAVPSFSWYNSGILASLLIAANADRLPEILAAVDDYRSVRRTAVFDDAPERDDAFDAMKTEIAEGFDVVSRVDGVKFEGSGITGLIRPSGTSPKLRGVFHTDVDSADIEAVADRFF